MITDKVTIWEQITRLVEDIPSIGVARVGRKLELTRQTDLVSDLGLVGDDAFEFMEKYASCLNVKQRETTIHLLTSIQKDSGSCHGSAGGKQRCALPLECSSLLRGMENGIPPSCIKRT